MTHDEMIAVIKAHKEGKTIEFRPNNNTSIKWVEVASPVWDFYEFEYREKPEAYYRPYKNIDEALAEIRKHGGWVKASDYVGYYYITHVCEDDDFEEWLKDTWEDDGTPLGILVKE